ncbi:hypothetical protein FACS1894217_02470 [Clostridia bacterium]|nr:hypothetical protein FACS1894217_02470 [Clostridia bacterium]
MKKLITICYLLSIICYLTSCSGEQEVRPSIYRVAGGNEPLEKITLPMGEYTFKYITEAVLVRNTVFAGVKCESAELDDATLTVALSREYSELAGLNRTLANACLILTLTALPDVDAVRVTVGSEEVGVMTERDFLLSEQLSDMPTAEFELYRIDLNSQRLTSERKRFVLREGERIEQCLYDELMSSGGNDRMASIIPGRAKLLSSEIEGGVLTLDVSAEFEVYEEAWMRELTLRGLVYAFTALDDVDAVRLKVEGVELTGELTRDDV